MTTSHAIPDPVLRNGRFTTLDRAKPIASAVAIREGKFVAVGDDAEVVPLAGATTRVIAEFEVNLAFAGKDGITNLGGSLPIIVDGHMLGAIGVSSGTTDHGAEVAQAGRDAVLAALGSTLR